MDMDALLKQAQIQTLVDTLELLEELRVDPGNTHQQQRILDIMTRLTNMAKTLLPGN